MFYNIINILGSLALFIFGMKIMSDAMQQFQSINFRNHLNHATKNRYNAVIAGLAGTTLVQSSSAFSVVLLGFVNAKILNLRRSIALVIGSNIGTTTTLWLLLFGFGWRLEIAAIPLIAIGLPLYLSNKANNKKWGQVIIGFALIFVGLYFLKSFVPDENKIYEFFNPTISKTYFYYLVFLIVGLIITIALQSSSATTGLILVILTKTNMPLELAFMMIIGANIGTTVTAHIAAYVGNYTTKLVAVFHSLFNVVGCIFFFFLVDLILEFLSNHLSIQDKGISLAIFHTLFNLITALFFLITFKFWLNLLLNLNNKLKKSRPLKKQLSHNNPDLYLIEANQEILKFAGITKQTISILGRLITESSDEKFEELKKRTFELEQQGDDIEKKVVRQLTNTYNFQTFGRTAKRAHNLMNVVQQLECIGDMAIKTADIHRKRRENNSYFTPKLRSLLIELHEKLSYATTILIQNLNEDQVNIVEAKKAEAAINLQYKENNESLLRALEREKIPMLSILYYQELIQNYEIIGDHIFKANLALVE